MASLALFAYLLTLVDSEAAGRAYAAYGGVYITASLALLWFIEGSPARPLGRDRSLDLPSRRRRHRARPAPHLSAAKTLRRGP